MKFKVLVGFIFCEIFVNVNVLRKLEGYRLVKFFYFYFLFKVVFLSLVIFSIFY